MSRNPAKLLNGVGYTLHQGPDGFWMEIDGGTQVQLSYPFQVSVKKVDGAYKATVKPGTANNIIPKISGTYLDDLTPPTLTLSSGKSRICLKVTYSTATFFPDNVEIVALTSDEAMAPSDSTAYLQLASVNIGTVNGSEKATVTQYIFSSQIVIRAKPGSGTAVWAFNSR